MECGAHGWKDIAFQIVLSHVEMERQQRKGSEHAQILNQLMVVIPVAEKHKKWKIAP